MVCGLLCLQGLLDKLASMEEELKSQQQKKEKLEADIEMCSIKLDRAEKLIGGLGGEKARWEEAALDLAKAQVWLSGWHMRSGRTAADTVLWGHPLNDTCIRDLIVVLAYLSIIVCSVM